MRAGILIVHRYLSLALAMLWILQALTGVLLVFRWELDDASINAARRPVDFVAIERRIEQLETSRPGWAATSIWTSATDANRFDVTLEDSSSGAARTWRVDGQGVVLRLSDPDDRLAGRGFFDTLTTLHQTLFLGDWGHWLIGISGLLLISNILLALKLALPRLGRWRAALIPSSRGPVRTWSYAFHRAAGLWLFAPAVILVASGAAMSFEGGLRRWLGAEIPAPVAQPVARGAAQLGPAQAVRVAQARHPGGSISAVVFPTGEEPWYSIRLLQGTEPRRSFGRTTLYVAATTGRILEQHDPLRSPLQTRVMDLLYPVHTGQVFGPPGRVGVVVIGLWLVTMSSLGVVLWNVRRRKRSPKVLRTVSPSGSPALEPGEVE